MSCGDIFLGLIAILFPPIAVWIKSGLCSADSLINILLCMLGYIPGLLHAWYIIAKYPEYDYEPIPDAESGHGQQRVTYYYISQDSRPQRQTGGYGTGNCTNRPPPAVPQNSRPQPPPAPSASNAAAAGPSTRPDNDESGAPPSYADAVRGDHKIQSQD